MLQEYVSNPAKLREDVKDMVLSGEVNPLLVKVMYDIFSDVMKDPQIKQALLDEADLHPKDFEVGGFNFQKSSRKSFSFKHDSEWLRLEAEKKAREQLMKVALEQEVVDPKTGEIVPAAFVTHSEFIKKR